jgi:signal peptidase I
MEEPISEHFSEHEIEETNKTFKIFINFFRDLVIILFIVIIIRTFFVTPFKINGSSMESSYHDKEYILVDKFSYLDLTETAFSKRSSWESIQTTLSNTWNSLIQNSVGKIWIKVWDPIRGDVVVITPHVDKNREYYIKRVIAIPGDTIRFSSGIVYIKEAWSESFIQLYEPYLSLANSWHTYLPDYSEWDQFNIPEWVYWIMWDNRNNSADSRSCFRNCIWKDVTAHFIKRGDILGKVLLNFWYFNILWEDGILHGGEWKWKYPPRFLNHPRTATYPELNNIVE